MTISNGAREKLTELLGSEGDADFVLTHLWADGFTIVPITEEGDEEDKLPDAAEVLTVVPFRLFRRNKRQ
jgi:hypothetical protein